MTPSPILIPRHRSLDNPSKQEKVDPIRRLCWIPTSVFFAASTVLLVALYTWPRRWVLSGAPGLTYCLLLGAQKGYRILPFINLWALLATLNLVYAIAATSWLLYGFFVAACYPTIFLTCIFQFGVAGNLLRHYLRRLLKQLQFVNDKVAFFNLPALEIDTDVAGLMVIRGITFHLSSLTIVAHDIELGIKLSDDMEIAIQVKQVTVGLFRRIEISDVFANLKGGEYEMTFHDLEENTVSEDGDPLMDTNTPLLRAATFGSDISLPPTSPVKIKLTEEMTGGHKLKDSSVKAGLSSTTQLSPDDASKQYYDMLDWLNETGTIQQCHRYLKDTPGFDCSNENAVRAAIVTAMQEAPSVPHPPKRSIKVTTLQTLSPRWQRHLMHRLPMLLRALLSPLSYFHPIHITSITAAGSGKFITHMLVENIFKQYASADAELRRLQAKLSKWLADADFAIEVVDVEALAQVPFLTEFNINAYATFGDVMAYRTLPQQVTQKEVVRLGGADATFTIPTFLLPHHEHLLPEKPSKQDVEGLKEGIQQADGIPKTLKAESVLNQAVKDEANIRMSVHGSLPACFDQELLTFIAALVKATKVVEMEREISEGEDVVGFREFAKTLNRTATEEDKEQSGFKMFAKSLNRSAKDGMKKAMVGGMVNDRWIAKMVGKVTKKLETAQGDVGYSGNIPVALDAYRPKGILPSKILP